MITAAAAAAAANASLNKLIEGFSFYLLVLLLPKEESKWVE